jgi:hypothetical protein
LSNRQFVALCGAIWRVCNDRYFAGKLLRLPYFRAVADMDSGAYHQTTKAARDRIVINRSAECTANLMMLIVTIVHEMVHQEQAQHSSPYIRREWHGRFFRRRAAEIVNAGLGFDIVSMYPKRKI